MRGLGSAQVLEALGPMAAGVSLAWLVAGFLWDDTQQGHSCPPPPHLPPTPTPRHTKYPELQVGMQVWRPSCFLSKPWLHLVRGRGGRGSCQSKPAWHLGLGLSGIAGSLPCALWSSLPPLSHQEVAAGKAAAGWNLERRADPSRFPSPVSTWGAWGTWAERRGNGGRLTSQEEMSRLWLSFCKARSHHNTVIWKQKKKVIGKRRAPREEASGKEEMTASGRRRNGR